MALGARFSDNRIFVGIDRRRRGDQYAERARKLLDLTDISVSTIQACILLGTVCFSDSQTKSESLYYSVAVRLALILDLPSKQCADQVERQINLRIWWSLYMIDIWSSAGLNLPRQLDFVEAYPLPTSEDIFLSLRSGATVAEDRPGLWSEMVILARIWARIHNLNKASVNSLIDYESLTDAADGLAQELHDWSANLQPDLQETPENLERYNALGLGNAFAALHLGYHYYNEVLFYQFLARTPDPQSTAPVTESYRSQCDAHALAFCTLLYTCRSTPTLAHQCQYVMVGHMLVVTSTVYIHMLLFSEDDEAKTQLARRRLAQNFEILTELQTFWVTLDVALSRLQVFHNACRRSIDESFRMDRWMLAFILEHGSLVVERPIGEYGEGEGDSPGTLRNWFLRTFD
ncbi:hypothetical protein ASPCAL04934 [Aspergillus calidoustus]|uniref:Xylanolytic transcriptional activator regulatory domain-containing protein n=1 Tax=Aspergillus calidoustus TaxID=454130 RepID=A0A0U5G2Q1_ASPCI|nr:hypothetical protein ASPCAL04934 [Aspergillus calidoustus]